MNLDTALRQAQAAGLDRLDAQLLVLLAIGTPAVELHARRSWLLAHGDDLLAPDAVTAFTALQQRRLAGEPLAYLTGHKEFFGLDLQVDARVLVPRPDTETLVEWALELLHAGAARADTAPLRALDLGTGSGAIALALRHQLPHLHMDAVDASAQALEVARSNAQRLGLPLRLLQGSWFAPVAGQRYHCVVSNPPYIAERDPHLPALAHEPSSALVSGTDGLDDIRNIVAQAGRHLLPEGALLLEHGYDQATAVRVLLTQAGFEDVASRRDLAGHARCSGGRWPGPPTEESAPLRPHGQSEIIPPQYPGKGTPQ